MRKSIIILVLAVCAMSFYLWYVRSVDIVATILHRAPPVTFDPSQNPADIHGWQLAAHMPTARTSVAAAALDGKVYVIGGVDGYGFSLHANEAFDTQTGTWRAFAAFPENLHDVGLVAAHGKLFAVGGLEGLTDKPSNSLYAYDPSIDVWLKGAVLPQPIGAAAVATDGDHILVFGGRGSVGPTETVMSYDIVSGIWSYLEPMAAPRDHSTAVYDGRYFYVLGGQFGSLSASSKDVDRYNPSGNQWDKLGTMPVPRGQAAAVVFNGKAYVFGGQIPGTVYDRVDSYDFSQDKWERVSTMPNPRYGLGAAVAAGRIFLVGGGKHSGFSVSDIAETFVP